jgi:streptogramin lyase
LGDLLVASWGEHGGDNCAVRVDGSTGYQSYLTQDRIDDLVFEDADTLLTAEPGILSERNPQTGERTREISQISGAEFGEHIALEATGNLLVLTAGYLFCDRFGCYHEPARIIRVDRLSGGQTVLVEDDELIGARGIELDAAGDPWIIVDTQAGPSIVRIDLQSEQRQTVAQGGLLVAPSDLAFGGAGALFVADRGAGALLEIDPGTGDQSLVSQGGYLISPTGLLVVPEPSQTLLLSAAVTVLACFAHSRRAPSVVGRPGDVNVRRVC